MKRLLAVVIAGILLLSNSSALASDVSGAIWSAVVRITNNSTAASIVFVPFSANTSVLIAGGYMNSSGNNTSIQIGGADVAYMPGYQANGWPVFVSSIGANTIIDGTLYMGGTTDMTSKIRWFPASGGGTVTDSASLEPSGNFSHSFSAYFDTTAGSGKYLANKSGAIATFVSPSVSGNITSWIYGSAVNGNILPTGNGTYNLNQIAAGDWTYVDDPVGAPDDGATQISGASTSGETESYTTNATGTRGQINSVTIFFRFRANNALGTAYVKPVLWLGTANTTGTEQNVAGTTYTTFNGTLTRPGGGDWSIEDFDNLQIGFSARIDNSAYFWSITQVYAVVNYYPVSASVSATGVASGEKSIRVLYPLGSSGNLTPTSANGTVWTAAASSYDSNWSTYAFDGAGTPAGTWGGFIEYNFTGNSSGVRMSANTNSGSIPQVDIDYWNGSAWIDIYEGTYSSNPGGSSGVYDDFLISQSILPQAYTKYRVQFYHAGPGATSLLLEFRPVSYYYLGVASEAVTAYQAVSPLSNLSVPNTSSNWTLAQNNVMPYIASVNMSVGGNLKGSWAWQYATTFTDQSGNGNTLTPSFRTASSDADVSAELVGFAPITEADAPPYTVTDPPDLITDNITVAGGFSSNTTVSTVPGIDVLTAVAAPSGTPVPFILYLLSGVFLLACSFGISYLMRDGGSSSLVVKILLILGLLGVLVALSIFDDWVLWLFAMIAFGIAFIAANRNFEGTGNANNNLIGFLIMSWLGLMVVNNILKGFILSGTETTSMNDFLIFQPWNVANFFTLPVPSIRFLTVGLPALMEWNYTAFGGNAQIFTYLMYSVSGVVGFIFFTVAMGAAANMFFRSR